MGGICSSYGGEENAKRILVRKPEGKRPLGRPRHKWVENIKMNLQDVRRGGMDWIELRRIWTGGGHL